MRPNNNSHTSKSLFDTSQEFSPLDQDESFAPVQQEEEDEDAILEAHYKILSSKMVKYRDTKLKAIRFT